MTTATMTQFSADLNALQIAKLQALADDSGIDVNQYFQTLVGDAIAERMTVDEIITEIQRNPFNGSETPKRVQKLRRSLRGVSVEFVEAALDKMVEDGLATSSEPNRLGSCQYTIK